MTNDVYFADFRNTLKIVITLKASRDEFVDRRFFHIQGRKTIANASLLRALKDQLFVWAQVRRNFCNFRSHKDKLTTKTTGQTSMPESRRFCWRKGKSNLQLVRL